MVTVVSAKSLNVPDENKYSNNSRPNECYTTSCVFLLSFFARTFTWCAFRNTLAYPSVYWFKCLCWKVSNQRIIICKYTESMLKYMYTCSSQICSRRWFKILLLSTVVRMFNVSREGTLVRQMCIINMFQN